MSQFAVIGLGQFGMSVARNLAHQGESVMAIDLDAELVENASQDADVAIRADATDERTLQELQLETMSCVVVAIGAHSIEASVLTTALLKQVGVPRIVARAMSDLHARVLRAIGADEVVNPEEEMGRRLAARLSQPSILEQVELGDSNLAEVEAPEAFVGKTLADLDIRNRYAVSIMAIQRGDQVIANPMGGESLQSGDVLVVVGSVNSIRNLASLA
ncbi:TrkA family potassium uptake protein [Lujinxingia vulgaris]|uniref:TrkA family potassium uptake protein n=2 Tax=Lujinxingia TaxID=2653226 RepID=A0A5C6XG60_9DELT|nr:MULTISPECIES: TrkA family potassium uptake protein [Lujinxingia]RDV37537.1 TrkA family potassium uptake protein [Bradymonadaceae bacterium TMQ3]RVU45774.1 TrkA family potassium uptake protein [Lujinxingia sediminis]TXC75092.1 TrkA family potassium uptake protein [Bradymonadales bacterium TMQ1]TXD42646.1 TrkA family potassium uptake protein [Lujinxingia vulgaris]